MRFRRHAVARLDIDRRQRAQCGRVARIDRQRARGKLSPGRRIAAADAGAAIGRALDLAAVALAAEQLGGMRRCLDAIVEYAKLRHEQGLSVVDAALDAAQLRFRPILMTSFAFLLGVLPLLYAGGAGAASRRALGTTVFGGMVAATFLAVFLVPVLYVVIQRRAERRRSSAVAPQTAAAGTVS